MIAPPTATALEALGFDAPASASIPHSPRELLGYLRVMFTVEDLDDTLARAAASSVRWWSDEVGQLRGHLSLCYLRGLKEFSFGLAHSSVQQTHRENPWNVSVETQALASTLARLQACTRPVQEVMGTFRPAFSKKVT